MGVAMGVSSPSSTSQSFADLPGLAFMYKIRSDEWHPAAKATRDEHPILGRCHILRTITLRNRRSHGQVLTLPHTILYVLVSSNQHDLFKKFARKVEDECPEERRRMILTKVDMRCHVGHGESDSGGGGVCRSFTMHK